MMARSGIHTNGNELLCFERPTCTQNLSSVASIAWKASTSSSFYQTTEIDNEKIGIEHCWRTGIAASCFPYRFAKSYMHDATRLRLPKLALLPSSGEKVVSRTVRQFWGTDLSSGIAFLERVSIFQRLQGKKSCGMYPSPVFATEHCCMVKLIIE